MIGPVGVRFPHERPGFGKLASAVAKVRSLQTPLVEKDYWITHTLWALENAGFRIYFKGGTSLSKGFGLIERFSEDLDIMIEGPDLPVVESWTSGGNPARANRIEFFQALEQQMRIPGAEVIPNPGMRSRGWRHAVFEVRFRSRTTESLPGPMRAYIQLEVGRVRTNPTKDGLITSWIHDHIVSQSTGFDGCLDNRPKAIRCVLPQVTLLEKIEAIVRRYNRSPFSPASFVRHYEDVAAILGGYDLPGRHELRDLLTALRKEKAIQQWPKTSDPSLNPAEDDRWSALETTWRAIDPFYWGSRTTLGECTQAIREFIADLDDGVCPRSTSLNSDV